MNFKQKRIDEDLDAYQILLNLLSVLHDLGLAPELLYPEYKHRIAFASRWQGELE